MAPGATSAINFDNPKIPMAPINFHKINETKNEFYEINFADE